MSGSAPEAGIRRPLPEPFAEALGCEPFGPERTLVGRIDIVPLGKGSDGVYLRAPEGDWLLAYDVRAIHRRYDGREVVVAGRACEKLGGAVMADHFAAEWIAEQRHP